MTRPIQRPDTFLLSDEFISNILFVNQNDLQKVFDESIKAGSFYYNHTDGLIYVIKPENMQNALMEKSFERTEAFKEISAVLKDFIDKYIAKSTDYFNDLAILSEILARNVQLYRYEKGQPFPADKLKKNYSITKVLAKSMVDLMGAGDSSNCFTTDEGDIIEYTITRNNDNKEQRQLDDYEFTTMN